MPDLSAIRAAGVANAYYVLLTRALLAERAGAYSQVAEVLSVALDPVLAPEIPGLYGLLPVLGRAALELGDEPVLVAVAEAARQEAERAGLPVRAAAANHCRGLMTGDPGPALAAAEYFGSVGRELNRGQALEDAAVLAARRDDLTAARYALAEAMASYEVLGAEWDIQRAGVRLRPFGIRRRRPAHSERPISGWGALTPTEVKVAGLVAAGKSNPDIAAELFLSRNTVQTHVSHILTKLGARSRVEIAAAALKHTSSQDRATA